jgi:hypothetical protein
MWIILRQDSEFGMKWGAELLMLHYLAEPLCAREGLRFEGDQEQPEAIRQAAEVMSLHLQPSSVVPMRPEPVDDPILVAHVLAVVLEGHLLQVLEDNLLGSDGLDGFSDGAEGHARRARTILHTTLEGTACDVQRGLARAREAGSQLPHAGDTHGLPGDHVRSCHLRAVAGLLQQHRQIWMLAHDELLLRLVDFCAERVEAGGLDLEGLLPIDLEAPVDLELDARASAHRANGLRNP